jgi:hypothetical protein
MKALIFYLLILFSINCSAQKIELNKEGLTINGTRMTKNSTGADIIKIFGEPDEKQSGVTSYLNYLSKGLSIGVNQATDQVYAILISLNANFMNGSKQFTGKFRISGYDITKNSYLQNVEHIPNLDITYKDTEGADGKIGNIYISIVMNSSAKNSKWVIIFFNNPNE